MVVGKSVGETSLKISKERMEEAGEFKYLVCGLIGNYEVLREAGVKKAEEWVGKVMWMSRVKVQMEVDRKDVVGAYQKTKFGAYSRNLVVRRVQ